MKLTKFNGIAIIMIFTLIALALPALGASINGNVKDGSGTGINNSLVNATNSTDSFSNTTDATGYFILNLPQGIYNITVSAAGYDSAVQYDVPIITGSEESPYDFIISAMPTGRLSGYVLNNAGTGINAASIQLKQGATVKAITATDGTGYYSMNVSTGSYDLIASKTGYVDGTASSLSITNGLTTDQNITLLLIPGTINGTVRTNTGAIVSGATVNIPSLGVSNTTDTSGNYVISNVPVGTYTLTASKDLHISNTTAGIAVATQSTTTQDFTIVSTCGNGAVDSGETYANCPSDVAAPASSSSSSSGGGYYVEVPVVVSKSWQILEANTIAVAKFDSTKFDVTEISMDIANKVQNAKLLIEKVTEAPNVEKISTKVYQYIKISKENMKDEDLKSAEIKFKIKASWLEENKIAKAEVALKRYDRKWADLPTEVLDSDANYVYFKAVTPGFSYFAISQKEIRTIEIPVKKENKTEEKKEEPVINNSITGNVVEPAKENSVVKFMKTYRNYIIAGAIILVFLIVGFKVGISADEDEKPKNTSRKKTRKSRRR